MGGKVPLSPVPIPKKRDAGIMPRTLKFGRYLREAGRVPLISGSFGLNPSIDICGGPAPSITRSESEPNDSGNVPLALLNIKNIMLTFEWPSHLK